MTETTTNVKLSIDETKGIAHLVFDRPEASANIFDVLTLQETIALTEELKEKPNIRGVIISSAKPNIFIAGADLKTLSSVKSEELKDILELGQRMTQSIKNLPFPKIAAINGACLGGGYELALACDWRVSSDSPKVKVGLPEVKLGILPGWGGTTRLPRLIGLTKALPLILSAKIINAKSAYHKGLTDGYCPPENLLTYAETFIQKGLRSEPHFPLTHNHASVAVIRMQAEKDTLAKTNGHYPAPLAAIKVACDGVLESEKKSLRDEREAFSKLATGSEAKNLIKLFFLTEKAKKLSISTDTPALEIKDAVVVGAGVMGSGISYWLTARGYPTLMKDLRSDSLNRGMNTVRKLYAGAVKRRVFTQAQAQAGIDRLTATNKSVVLKRDLIVEAAVEQLEIKQKIFQDLAQKSRPDTILATNTSALPIAEIAKVTPNPERVVGLHFFNPVHLMPLVEVVKTEYTSPATLAATVAFVQKIGKSPVVVKDSPGFLVNRVLVPYLLESAVMFMNGADPMDLDKAMVEFGMPMGPIRLMDEVGLDVCQHVARTLAAAFPDRMKVPSLLEKMIKSGMLGKKKNQGFYLYEKGKETGINSVIQGFQEGSTSMSKADITDRLVGMMKDETQLCIDEGVVEGTDEANLAMILGTGFAPFRGGPLGEH